MAALQGAVEEKRKGDAQANAREGALFAFECLTEALGRLFEPYVITIPPLLLHGVADGSGPVRYAAVAASQRITVPLHKRRATLWNRIRWNLSWLLVSVIEYTVTRRLNLGI